MSKHEDTKKINRRFIPSLLAKKYKQDYKESVAEFPEGKKIEFVEHLLECLDIIETYMSDPTKENWKTYSTKENAFLKKHGKRLKVYRQKSMYLYYGDPTVLSEKEIYTTEEWGALSGEEQVLSPEEFASFVRYCRNMLHHERDFLLLEQTPEDEQEGKNANDALTGTNGKQSKKGKIKREALDNKTSLSQEQTVLLIHYLQQERIILKDEYLNDKEAGEAFGKLTGYSENTLRLSLGKYQNYQNKTNLKELNHIITRLSIAIEKDLRGK